MKRIIRIVSDIFIAAAVIVIVFAGKNLYGLLSNYSESNREYDEIRGHTSHSADTGTDEELQIDRSNGFTPGAPLDVDFDSLREINPDIIAWLWVPGLDISYPILQGRDNDQYLHATYQGTYAYAGSIFIDCQNKPDFFDRNTIIYGHNMNNGSMFGKLKNYVDLAEPPLNPYIWVMTEDVDFCYKIFTSHISEDSSDDYLLFDKNDESFPAWEQKMRDLTTVDFEEVPFSRNDRVITLSTCHSDHVHRRIVHAQLIYEKTPGKPGEDAITLE